MFLPADFIICRGDIGNEMYFLREGFAGVFTCHLATYKMGRDEWTSQRWLYDMYIYTSIVGAIYSYIIYTCIVHVCVSVYFAPEKHPELLPWSSWIPNRSESTSLGRRWDQTRWERLISADANRLSSTCSIILGVWSFLNIGGSHFGEIALLTGQLSCANHDGRKKEREREWEKSPVGCQPAGTYWCKVAQFPTHPHPLLPTIKSWSPVGCKPIRAHIRAKWHNPWPIPAPCCQQ